MKLSGRLLIALSRHFVDMVMSLAVPVTSVEYFNSEIFL